MRQSAGKALEDFHEGESIRLPEYAVTEEEIILDSSCIAAPGVAKSRDGKRRLLAPLWKPPAQA